MGKKNKGRVAKRHKFQGKGKSVAKNGASYGGMSGDSGMDSGMESDVEKTTVAPTERKPGSVSVGFPKLDGYTSDAEPDTRELVKQMNRKKKKSGGFQSMGLSHPVFNGIMKKGYKIPTPIQRKCVPIIMEGKDVVAMARTGSGKTAAFLIPMFEKLQQRSAQSGARALILSPTRELALQTLKFSKELGRYTSLKAEVILGGDKLDDQFAALHENPDVIIATPGRLLHVLVEMEMKLKSVQYVVFDEADRLFEMGFAEQLHEILHSLPQHRQTLLFSATLPKSLVEFAKAGLNGPTLIRLDVETKISEQLQMLFFYMRPSDKVATLLHLLRNVIKQDELTVVFMATKHHVEYMNEILFMANIDCTYIYSDLDQAARKINVAKFTRKKTKVMLVTDVAARGIDIPMLDNVINYNFPGKPKLYVHRVGRVARAGRSGRSFSLISPDELPYLLDLHLFLGRSLKQASVQEAEGDDSVIGRVPQSVIDDEDEILSHFHRQSVDLVGLRKACNNASKQYLKTRPHPSVASLKRVKEIGMEDSDYHPIFGIKDNHQENKRVQLVDNIKNYKPKTTIFEIATSTKSMAHQIMKSKRRFHGDIVKKNRLIAESPGVEEGLKETVRGHAGAPSTEKDIQDAFSAIIAPGSKRKSEQFVSLVADPKKPKMDVRTQHRDEDYYISHHAPDRRTEQGLSVGLTFDQQADSAQMDLTQDDPHGMIKQRGQLKWERKKMKFVNEIGKERPKKIKTESGALIAASYKKNLYKEWLERSKADARMEVDESDAEEESDKANSQDKISRLGLSRHMKNRLKSTSKASNPASKYDKPLAKMGRGGKNRGMKGRRGPKQEVKSHDQILKRRRTKEKNIARNIPRKQRQQAVKKKMEGKQLALMKKSKFNKRK